MYAIYVLVFISVVGAHDDDTYTVQYDTHNFFTDVPKKNHFIMFYAPWCGHCNRLAPTWEELAKSFNKKSDSSVTIAKVDCTRDTSLCSEHDVTGYPTLKFFKSGDPEAVKFRGTRDLASLSVFINEQLGIQEKENQAQVPKTVNGLVELTEDTFAKHVAKGRHFVKFYAPWCGHCQKLAPTWDALAKSLEHDTSVTVSKVDCTVHRTVCNTFDIKGYPTLLWIEDGKKVEKYQGHRTHEDLKAFVSEMLESSEITAPKTETDADTGNPVLTLSGENFQSTTANGISFIKFFAPWCGHCKRLAPTWEELGKKFVGSPFVKIVKVDCTLEASKELCNQQEEAYRTYLEGLALVAAALQQDAENSWTLGNPSFTGKERRSLIGFAKQSIDRIVLLLDKQDQESSNIIKETTEIVDNEKKKRNFRDLSFHVPKARNVHMGTSPVNGTLSGEPGGAAVFSVCNDQSPLALMQHENKCLVARYAVRMQNATSAVQRQNLQLELERRLVENAVIARQHQEQWEQRRTEAMARCNKISEMKFNIQEKIENGTITESDFKKQRLYAAALQFEEENPWLKAVKNDMQLQPQNDRLQRDLIKQVLLDRTHPFGSLLCQMQYAVLDKICPVLNTHCKSLAQGNSNEPRMAVREELLNASTLDHRLLQLQINEGDKQVLQMNPLHDRNQSIVKEEHQVFERLFQNVAIDIKQDLRLLESLITVLFDLPISEKGFSAVDELLQQVYFAPLKPHIILLLKLITKDEEHQLEMMMLAKQNAQDVTFIEDELKHRVSNMLRQLISLNSPCEMLDVLVSALKMLALRPEEDSHCKSLGADDLVPRLMTIVMDCSLHNLLPEVAYMENFMPTDRALGEGGYAVTVLQSVLTCLLSNSG